MDGGEGEKKKGALQIRAKEADKPQGAEKAKKTLSPPHLRQGNFGFVLQGRHGQRIKKIQTLILAPF